MTKEQLFGSVTALLGCAVGIFYFGQAATQPAASPLPGAVTAAHAKPPSTLSASQLACANVPKSTEADVQIVMDKQAHPQAKQAASLRMLCDLDRN